jgi:hypothetical protein
VTVEEVRRELEAIGRVSLRSDPLELRPRVEAALAAARAADGGIEARRLSGWLTGVLSSLAFTSGAGDQARRLLREAVAAADATGDDALRLWLRSQRALMDDGDDGTDAPDDEELGPPSFAAVRLLALRARARAGRGDRAGAEAALARAWALLPRLPPEQRGAGLFGYPEEKLASVEGDVWLRLDEPERARAALERALRGYETAEGDRRSLIDRALVRLKLATALVALGRRDEAAALREEALALDPQHRFASIGLRAAALAEALARSPGSGAARDAGG